MDRSANMRAIRGKNTRPEMFVRRLVHGMGYRFRLHRANLAGKPDLVFPSRSKVIFVHGCFWHGHTCRTGRRVPIQNRPYWVAKITSNKARDKTSRNTLKKSGWHCLVLWECQLKDTVEVQRKIVRFLSAKGRKDGKR
jgi:DNA mismatch endonuclease (patch repair protein)